MADERRLVVCLIEDDSVVRSFIVSAFVHHGFAVVCCQTSDELDGLLLAVTPDVFLIDLALSRERGEDVMRELRARPDYAHTPMLAYTARGFPGDRIEGFDDVVVKPVPLADLIARVRAALAQRGT